MIILRNCYQRFLEVATYIKLSLYWKPSVKKYQTVDKSEALSVDEQMYYTKVSNILRHYRPNKQQDNGDKLVALCNDRRCVYEYEIFLGMTNNTYMGYSDKPDLGANINIAVRLTKYVFFNQNYILFFENYCIYSYLDKEYIQLLGTVNKLDYV